MRKNTFKILLFILIFFALDLCVDRILSQWSKKTNSIYTKFLHKEPEVVFLGDSKLRSSINPKVLKENFGISSYNASFYGTGMIYASGMQAITLEHYKPKVFVLQSMTTLTDRGAMNALTPFLNNPKVYKLLDIYPYYVALRHRLLKSSKYNWMLLTMVKRLFVDYDLFYGYVPRYGAQKVDRTSKKEIPRGAMLDFGAAFHDYEIPMDQLKVEQMILDFVDESRAYGVKVVIVAQPMLYGPVDDSYYVFKRIAEEKGVLFLDYTKKSNRVTALKEKHFNDPIHLNHQGAKIFSQIMGEEIKKIIMGQE
jgi:hypothetical protein